MNIVQDKRVHRADICVIGGGLAGLSAALSAARHGARVVLMQDRPMLGGNASSEIRMWVRGAHGLENRETGIIQELELENIYRNPTMNHALWDSVLYQAAIAQDGLELLLNCSCLGCDMEDGRIASVTGWQLNSYTYHQVWADIFLDCSGDSILAPLSGAPYRVGRESREEFGESAAPPQADRHTMGSSCLIQARKTDHPCAFIPPDWAYRYPDDQSMYLKNHDVPGTGVNFWWIEVGGEQDTIRDAQSIQGELLKIAYGVWDHIKNRGDHGMENWELEWIGFLPGKRESRRYEGAYMLTQNDLEQGRRFEDAVAFGGWTMDNHSPRGFYFNGYSSRHIAPKTPYQIPFRCLYSRHVPNLMFAGRNISATHMAMSSTRVMATCAVMGQAAGAGAALAVKWGCLPQDMTGDRMRRLQQALLEDGCFIPGLIRQDTGQVRPRLNGQELAVLQDGWERPYGGLEHAVTLPEGGSLTLDLRSSQKALRLALDPDFSRESISSVERYRRFAMRAHVEWPQEEVHMPAHLLRGCTVVAVDGHGKQAVCCRIQDNRLPRLRIPLPPDTRMVHLRELTSWGGQSVRLFSCDAARF